MATMKTRVSYSHDVMNGNVLGYGNYQGYFGLDRFLNSSHCLVSSDVDSSGIGFQFFHCLCSCVSAGRVLLRGLASYLSDSRKDWKPQMRSTLSWRYTSNNPGTPFDRLFGIRSGLSNISQCIDLETSNLRTYLFPCLLSEQGGPSEQAKNQPVNPWKITLV